MPGRKRLRSKDKDLEKNVFDDALGNLLSQKRAHLENN